MAPQDDDLQKLTQAAASTVAAQEAHSADMAAKASAGRRQTRSKLAWMLVLLATCFGTLAFQWRALREPFAVASVGERAAVVEADLRAIASFVDAYRLSQGRYPDSLTEVRLPEGLAALASEVGVQYARADAAYTLRWAASTQQLVFDGASGQIQPAAGNKP